jgi:SAM-dependent methyltransferase
MNVLTTGNSAKLYCLNWIERYAVQQGRKSRILDLGCGAAINFVNLLQSYPEISYVGIEPSRESYLKAQQNLSGLNARLINSSGYRAYDVLREKFDIVVSFSVLEHVYKRLAYLRSAKECLKANGYFLINYDSGHFRTNKERLIGTIGRVLARFGDEKYYQVFVKEKDFRNMAGKTGFSIIEDKFFNTGLKGTYKVVPHSKRAQYMNKWLELELWLNELEIDYNDAKAKFFGTRNFILTHR